MGSSYGKIAKRPRAYRSESRHRCCGHTCDLGRKNQVTNHLRAHRANLLSGVFVMPPSVGNNINVTRLSDNQAEASIAVNPFNPFNLFVATMTLDGRILGSGVADPTVNVPNVFTNHTPGLLVAFSMNGGAAGSWSRRIMLTGGPTELSRYE